MRVYISGPITGMPDKNWPAFDLAENALSALGHDVVNPHKLCAYIGQDAPWEYYMRACVAALCDCDAIYPLKGWEKSRGAMFEVYTASTLGIKLYE